jgi:hypothetical protein
VLPAAAAHGLERGAALAVLPPLGSGTHVAVVLPPLLQSVRRGGGPQARLACVVIVPNCAGQLLRRVLDFSRCVLL